MTHTPELSPKHVKAMFSAIDEVETNKAWRKAEQDRARLIAAAPALLEALELALECLELDAFGLTRKSAIYKARDAIELAKGESE